MDKKAELELLRDRAQTVDETIRDLDDEIEQTLRAAASGGDGVEHALAMFHDRRNTQLGLMYDLGKVEAQIEDLEHRIREQDEHEQEKRAAHEWETEVPVAQEDHLDWLRPVLDAPAPEQETARDERHPHYEGEERMLAEMHRKAREPEDYLDWWKR